MGESPLIDPFSPENKSAVTASFKIEHLRDGGHIVYLPIPDDVFRLIGAAVAHWGTFEVEMNKLIAALLAAIPKVVPGWERLGFTKRKKLLVDLIKAHLEGTIPEAAKRYRAMLGMAADLYWRRNLVAHGQYRVTFPPAGPNAPTFWAEGVHNGKTVQISIDAPTLEKLWHDIAHLGGELRAIAALHGSVEGWPWTFPDKEILRVYRESIHPWNPNPDKRPRQPEPSQG